MQGHSSILAFAYCLLFFLCFTVRAHSIRGMATSAAFARNVSLSSIPEGVTWSSSTVFTSFYLCDVQFSSGNGFSLGLVVAVGAVV